jgi:hypothetical protein
MAAFQVVHGPNGRALVATAALDPGEVVIVGDVALCHAPAFAARRGVVRSRTCACCLRYLATDALAQLQELAGEDEDSSPPPRCGDCIDRTDVAWLTQPEEMRTLLALAAARRIGPPLVSLAAAIMERNNRANACEASPLAGFYAPAAYEARRIGARTEKDRRDVDDCYRLLSATWARTCGETLKWSLGSFSKLLGIIATNAIEVKVPHPLVFKLSSLEGNSSAAAERQLETLRPLLETLVRRSAQRLVAENSDREDDEDSDDDDEVVDIALSCRGRTLSVSSACFPASRGVALFPTVAGLNHSCAPNCELIYAHSPDARASIITTASVEPGSELFISYIDIRLGLQERQEALQNRYGFVCACERCADETRRRKERKRARSAAAQPSGAGGRRASRRSAHA